MMPTWLKCIAIPLLLIALIGVGIVFAPGTAHAIYPFDFGGRVVWVYYCVNGLWTAVSVPTPGLFFYIWGFSGMKAVGPPTHAGQQVLGKSYGVMVCLVPCVIGVCPIGYGWLVSPNAGSSPS
ncbi:MAG TPA: hypothetical protein PLF31_01990 [Candidatus Paceibacterota bacterium]|nr:hypothetical protein [Candidatus Paceibacterota bacterium]